MLDEFAHRTFNHDPCALYSTDQPVRAWRAATVGSLAGRLELGGSQAVPIFDSIDQFHFVESAQDRPADVLTVALQSFPIPAQDSSWDDILEFREAEHDKHWALRRFLHSIATKNQSEAETRDDVEWTLNEYTKAMAFHNLKASGGFFEVYVIPAIEVIEDVAKFNWSKIAKGALSVRKRQLELTEAEMRAPGRECAYLFDARKRFGGLPDKERQSSV